MKVKYSKYFVLRVNHNYQSLTLDPKPISYPRKWWFLRWKRNLCPWQNSDLFSSEWESKTKGKMWASERAMNEKRELMMMGWAGKNGRGGCMRGKITFISQRNYSNASMLLTRDPLWLLIRTIWHQREKRKTRLISMEGERELEGNGCFVGK